MNQKWTYHVVEIGPKFFEGSVTERMQQELERLGAQGWELVSVVQISALDHARMFFKKAV